MYECELFLIKKASTYHYFNEEEMSQFQKACELYVHLAEIQGRRTGILKTDLWPVQTDLEIFRPIYFA